MVMSMIATFDDYMSELDDLVQEDFFKARAINKCLDFIMRVYVCSMLSTDACLAIEADKPIMDKAMNRLLEDRSLIEQGFQKRR